MSKGKLMLLIATIGVCTICAFVWVLSPYNDPELKKCIKQVQANEDLNIESDSTAMDYCMFVKGVDVLN